MSSKITRKIAKGCVGKGWSSLIDKLYDKLPKDVEVLQVKEKFGSLRFYIGSATKEIHDFITEVEDESCTICEVCGEPGDTVNIKGWLSTLCDKHQEEYRNGTYMQTDYTP